MTGSELETYVDGGCCAFYLRDGRTVRAFCCLRGGAYRGNVTIKRDTKTGSCQSMPDRWDPRSSGISPNQMLILADHLAAAGERRALRSSRRRHRLREADSSAPSPRHVDATNTVQSRLQEQTCRSELLKGSRAVRSARRIENRKTLL